MEHLSFRKLCVWWVPKQLTQEHKAKRMKSALTFLQRYNDGGDEFLDRIITGDETWLLHTLLQKTSSSQCIGVMGGDCDVGEAKEGLENEL